MKTTLLKIITMIIAAAVILTGCGVGSSASEEALSGGASSSREPSGEEVKADIDPGSAVVSYLGPQGTYTQEACGKFFDARGSYKPYETVGEAVNALCQGQSNYAVIPQENTIGGAVVDYLDILISHKDVSVVGEVELAIDQNLLVLPGAELGDIKTVYSHKQGIAQGRQWLEKNIPGAKIVEVSSTAEGAKMISQSKDKTCAAIASAACADVYGLKVMAQAIQGNRNNKTRFYVLSTQKPPTAKAKRLAFIARGKAEDLPALMSELKGQGMSLVTIHDRPQKTLLGEYDYVIECADSSYGQYTKLAEGSRFELRFLGCFDVAG